MNNLNPIKVVLADDSSLVRKGVRAVLENAHVPIIVVCEVGLSTEVLEACTNWKPHVLLLDVRFSDGNGLEICKKVVECIPELKVIILTSYSNDGFVYQAIMSGAKGYLMKEIDPDGLVRAVVDVHAGKSILDPEATSRVMHLMRGSFHGGGREEVDALSPQERKVISLVAAGKTNKEIGEVLALSDNTVRNYLGNVYDKLHVKRRSQAAALWVRSSGLDRENA